MSDKTYILFSKNSTRIVSTLERIPGQAILDSVSLNPDQAIDEVQYNGSTDCFWNDQATVYRNNQRVFVDENYNEHLEATLYAVPSELEDEVERKLNNGSLITEIEQAISLAPNKTQDNTENLVLLKAKLDSLTSEIGKLIDEKLLNDGDTCETSQRICAIQALQELECVINGIESQDLRD